MAAGVKRRIAVMRERWPVFDHAVSTVEHYNRVEGNLLAGAVTFFGFLSFFPLLALGFSVVGFISGAYPDARDSLVTAIQQIFPGIVSAKGAGDTISLAQIEQHKGTAGIIGLVALLYSGLNWVSGQRDALENAFNVPRQEQPNFVKGKAIDLAALVVIGVILIVSVSIAGVVQGATGDILDSVGLEGTWIGSPLLWAISTVLGIVANTLLFFVMYRVLGSPDIPASALLSGALFAAIGFEIVKIVAVNILGGVGGTTFASLAIAVTLVIWINYFARLVIAGACWAMTSRVAHGRAERATVAHEAAAVAETLPLLESAVSRRGVFARFDPGSAVFGGVVGAAVGVFLRRPRE